MNTICRLIGHKVDDNYTDSGTYICKRCKSHAYYDYDRDKWDKDPLLFIIRNKILRLKDKYTFWKERKGLPF